jgi:NADPH-dependent ferric siderophore reductase
MTESRNLNVEIYIHKIVGPKKPFGTGAQQGLNPKLISLMVSWVTANKEATIPTTNGS